MNVLQLTTPLKIVGMYVTAGYTTSEAIQRTIRILEETCAEHAGESEAKVLRLAVERASATIIGSW